MSSIAGLVAAFDIVAGYEGEDLDLTYDDRGNWSSGRIGVGRLGGSRWGLSSATYPDLDLRTLTREGAREIYRRDFWQPLHCDALPPGLALALFDAAVHSGQPRATMWLQSTVGTAPDGNFGPATLAAVQAAMHADPVQTCSRFVARRLHFLTASPLWALNAADWSWRLSDLPFRCASLGWEASS